MRSTCEMPVAPARAAVISRSKAQRHQEPRPMIASSVNLRRRLYIIFVGISEESARTTSLIHRRRPLSERIF